ncbi:hypothetical protein HYZ98_05355 [Candidatus Peregrinibacteria bacterium]|nr:hypothetical protein [Candidatus Peregrinibacteria bacterium]
MKHKTMDPTIAHAIQAILFSQSNGHTVSSQGRSRLLGEGALKYSDGNFTYGEVTPEGMEQILAPAIPREGEVFYDLGSGTGKGVIFASTLFPFKKCVGIELLPDLHAVSQEVRDRFEREIKPAFGNGWDPNVEFRQEDFADSDFSDADIVFAHATCFEEGLMATLQRKFEALKEGARVILVTKTLSSPILQWLTTSVCPFSWGSATVSCYRRGT